jgi:cyclophilin family peptidyl-prolyl cis-trans isomerase
MSFSMTPAMTMTMTLLKASAALLLAALLSSCGGGGGGSASSGPGPTISALQANNTVYGRVMTISVSGQALDQGLEMTVDNVCTSVTRLAGGSEFSQTFSCRVGSIGEFNLRFQDSGGRAVGALSVMVPLPQVTLTTSKGVIVVELDLPKAPLSVDNFLRYVTATPSFYVNSIFHRVEAPTVIQAGGYATGLLPKTAVHAPIALESSNGLKNLRGTIGMAREAASAASATSQFFFNLKDNPEFDFQTADKPGFAVFGKVISGLEVMDAIGAVPVRFDLTQNLANVPVAEVLISGASQTK